MTAMHDFIRERLCFYSPVLKGQRSSWDILRAAARHGVAGVELMNFADELRTPDRKTAAELGAYARQNGLRLPCFSCAVDFSKDTKQKIDYIKGYADICADLEIPYLHHTLVLPLHRAKLVAAPEVLMPIAVECALEIREYAAKRGVKTLVEEQGLVVNGLAAYNAFRSQTEGKIGLLFDAGNVLFVDERPEDFCKALGHEVRHVHLKDYKLTSTPLPPKSYETAGGQYLTECELGEGTVDHATLSQALKAAGYRGDLALEFAPAPDDEALAARLCRIAAVYA